MNTGLKIVAVFAVMLGVAVSANASVTVNVDAGFLYGDAAASELLSGDSLAVLVVDADGDGWGAYDGLVEGSFVADAEDEIFDIFATNSLTYGPGTHSGQHVGDGLTNGAQFALLWFNTSYSEELKTTGPAAGTSYGFYTSGDLVVPEEGSLVVKQLFTVDTTAGTISDSEMAAPFSVVPEPFTMSVLAIGGLAMLRRRRAA